MQSAWSRVIGLASLLMPAAASAQSEIFGPEAFAAQADLRPSLVGGEDSFLDGGFGKLRYGGDNGETQPRLRFGAVDLAWTPQFTWFASAVVSVTAQDGQSNVVDLNEAFLRLKAPPGKVLQLSGKLGYFYPPVSLEHGGALWAVGDSITPSAINSWIGEEVKVVGGEATAKSKLGGHELSLTGALFKYNDTSGTLLSYRGWALHDFKATRKGAIPLPPLSPMIAPYQDEDTIPTLELDHKIGWYARGEWRPPLPVTISLLRYDNRGDRESSESGQTSWDTRFWALAAAWSVDDRTTLKSQLLWGETLVGPMTPMGYPVDVDFAAAYVLATRAVGSGSVSARADWFEARDDTFVAFDDNREHGWAAMLAFKHPIARYVDGLVEVLHVDSKRRGRALYGEVGARQSQTLLQAALRLSYPGRIKK